MELEKQTAESKIRVYQITINELENKIKLLTTENNRLSSYLDEKIKETESLRRKLSKEDVSPTYDSIISELQDKLKKMINTNQTCNRSTSSILKELEDLQISFKELKSKYERENEKIRKELQDKDSYIELEKKKWEYQLKTLKGFFNKENRERERNQI